MYSSFIVVVFSKCMTTWNLSKVHVTMPKDEKETCKRKYLVCAKHLIDQSPAHQCVVNKLLKYNTDLWNISTLTPTQTRRFRVFLLARGPWMETCPEESS